MYKLKGRIGVRDEYVVRDRVKCTFLAYMRLRSSCVARSGLLRSKLGWALGSICLESSAGE